MRSVATSEGCLVLIAIVVRSNRRPSMYQDATMALVSLLAWFRTGVNAGWIER